MQFLINLIDLPLKHMKIFLIILYILCLTDRVRMVFIIIISDTGSIVKSLLTKFLGNLPLRLIGRTFEYT